jgi:hypothetical protein
MGLALQGQIHTLSPSSVPSSVFVALTERRGSIGQCELLFFALYHCIIYASKIENLLCPAKIRSGTVNVELG